MTYSDQDILDQLEFERKKHLALAFTTTEPMISTDHIRATEKLEQAISVMKTFLIRE